jgi:glycosyltransferase involved in cell wall biosynthesis
LRDAYPRLHLLIVGPFEVRDPVPPETERVLRSDPRIHLVGLDWNTPPLYAAMDVVTLPSYREGFPSVPLEAAAMGLPVVATNVPGCADAVVDGETGLLVDAGDAAALAGSIRRYIDDPDLRRLHGEAGRERVLRRFQPRSVWRALHEVYIHALDAVPHDGTLGAEPDSRKVVGMR